MVAGLLALGARALPLLARVGPAITEGVANAGTVARVVGAGARGKAGSATGAVSNILQQESRAARLAGIKQAKETSTIFDLPQVLKTPEAYAQGAKIVADNPFLKTAYSAGNVLNQAGKAAGPIVNVGNTVGTGLFVGSMLLPQTQPDPTIGYEPFNNAYTQLPTPSGGQYPTNQRGAEMVGGMQASAMMNDQPGQSGAPYGLTDEQIVKAKRRAEETAQLNQLYASTLQQYQQPY